MSWKIDCSVAVMFVITKAVYYGNYLTSHRSNASIFAYLSYCFFFPSVMIGPTFQFTTFEHFICRTFGYQNPQIKLKLLGIEFLKTIFFTVVTVIVMPTFTPYWALKS